MAHIILFAGGINSTALYPRYKEDLRILGRAFLSRSAFCDASVTALYGPGTEVIDLGPYGQVESKPATAASLKELITGKLSQLRQQEKLLFVCSNHGGRNDDKTRSTIWCWKNESVEDEDFAKMCSLIPSKEQLYIFGQCYSGGFVRPMASQNRSIMTASAWDEVSWSHGDGSVDEFMLRVSEAIQAGIESLSEVFAYARNADSRPEKPQLFISNPELDIGFLKAQ